MTSNRPYLLRALNEWILDNGLTPHILVDTLVEGVHVPTDYIEEDKIVLNISPNATRDLVISNDFVLFSARFNGTAMSVEVPMQAVMAIYAQENGQSMVFPEEQLQQSTSEPESQQATSLDRSHLKLVK